MSIYRNLNNEVGYYLQGNTNIGIETLAEARAEVAKADWVMLQWKWSSAKAAEKVYVSQIRALRPNGVKLLMYSNPRMWWDNDETGSGGTHESVWKAVSTLGAPASWRARNAAGQQMSHRWGETESGPVNRTNAPNVCSRDLNSQGQTFAQAWLNRLEETMALDLYDGIMIDDFNIIPEDYRPKSKSGSSNWSYKNDGIDYDGYRDLNFGEAFREGMMSIVNEIRRRRPAFLLNFNTNPGYFYRQNFTGSWKRPWSSMQYYRTNDIASSENGLGFGAGLSWPGDPKHTYLFKSWFNVSLIFETFRFYQDLTRPANINLAGASISFLHQEMNLGSTDTPLAVDYAFARACWAMTKLEEGVGYGCVRNPSRPFFLDETCLKLGNVVGGLRSMGTHDTTTAPSKFIMRSPNLQVGAAKFYWQEFDNALVVCRLDTDGLTMGTSRFGDGNAVAYTLPPAGAGKKWKRFDCRNYVHPEFADLRTLGQDSSVNSGADATTSALKPMHGEVFLRVKTDGSGVAVPPNVEIATTTPGTSSATYRYLKWVITQRKAANVVGVQVADLELRYQGNSVAWNLGATATNPGGVNPVGEEPSRLIDNNSTTKWLNSSFSSSTGTATGTSTIVIDNTVPVTFDGYRWRSANDVEGRDPVAWIVQGSNDNVSYTTISTQNDPLTSTLRLQWTNVYALNNANSATPPPYLPVIITPPVLPSTRVEPAGIMFSLDPTNPDSYPGTGADIVDVDIITNVAPPTAQISTTPPNQTTPTPGPQGPQGPLPPVVLPGGLRFPRLGTYWIGDNNFGSAAYSDILACHETVIFQWLYNPGFAPDPTTLESMILAIKAKATFAQKFYQYENINELFNDGAEKSVIINKMNSMNWWLYPGTATTGTVSQAVRSSVATNLSEVNLTTYVDADARGLKAGAWLAEAYVNQYFRNSATDVDFSAMLDGPAYSPTLNGLFFDNCFFTPRVKGNWNRSGAEDALNDPVIAKQWRLGYRDSVRKARQLGAEITAKLTELPSRSVGGFPVGDFGAFPFEEFHYEFDGGAIEHFICQNYGPGFEGQQSIENFKLGYLRTMKSLVKPDSVVAHIDYRGGSINYEFGAYGLGLVTVFGDAAAYIANNGGKPVWLDEMSVNRDTGVAYSGFSATGVRSGLRWLGREIDPLQADKLAWQNGVHRRRFEFGEVYVNYRGNGTKTVKLDRPMKKIQGTQRASVNNGQTVTELVMPERSAVFLLYPGMSADLTDSYYLSYDPLNTNSYPGSGTTLTDLSGAANSATLVGGVTYSSGAFTFNGTSSYIQSSKTFADPEEFTIETWFQTTGNTGKKIVGFENSNTATGSTNYDRHLYVGTDGRLKFGVYDGATKIIQSTSNLAPNTWYHAVATHRNNTQKLYLNGVLQASGTSNGAENFTGYWRIGSYAMGGWAAGTTGYFSGKVGVTAIHRRELPPAEILTRYTENSGRYSVPAPTLTPPGPVVTLTTINSTTINISIAARTTDNSTPTNYAIERSPNGANGWTQIHSGSAATFSNTGLTATTTYYYRARFTQVDTKVSDFSSVASAATTANVTVAPPTPTSQLNYPQLGMYWIGNSFDSEMGGFDTQYLTTKGINIMSRMNMVIINGWPELESQRNHSNHQIAQAVKAASTKNTKIFFYFDTEGVHNTGAAYATRKKKIADEKWYVYSQGLTGTPLNSYYANWMYAINVTTKVRRDAAGRTAMEWLADYEPTWIWGGAEKNTPTDLIDGVFFDNCLLAPSTTGDFDLDGSSDSHGYNAASNWKYFRPDIALLYQAGVAAGINRFRSRYPAKLALGNIADINNHSDRGLGLDSSSPYWKILHGGVMEWVTGLSFSVETWSNTATAVKKVQITEDYVIQPELCLFHAVSDDGMGNNYQAMRHSLAFCLVTSNMAFSFQVDENQGKAQWYDEYDFNLGKPLEPRQTAPRFNGIWRRDFENGIVIWAPKGASGFYNLGGTFYRLRGTQAPEVNTGGPATSLTFGAKNIKIWANGSLSTQSVNGRDGIILSRTPT